MLVPSLVRNDGGQINVARILFIGSKLIEIRSLKSSSSRVGLSDNISPFCWHSKESFKLHFEV